ncbi:hypothetical protein [Pseudomonas sp. NFR16]|uniref:hypothetical protein n=1 Tax=Pseudomonas sp. NFR16 TaxID=1566248 RepID=UPI0011601EC4|nr:hypothetical protein [Pseudomonas sp. NFR16]
MTTHLTLSKPVKVKFIVSVVDDANGVRSVLRSTGEPRDYLRPGVRLQEGKKVVVGTGHAEADIVSYANANGVKGVDIGAIRPVRASCRKVIEQAAANVSTPLKPLPSQNNDYALKNGDKGLVDKLKLVSEAQRRVV